MNSDSQGKSAPECRSHDLFDLGAAADARARACSGGRGFFTMGQAVDRGPSLLRVPYAFGESDETRLARLAEAASRLTDDATWTGLGIVPEGEPQGLDTLQFVAWSRLYTAARHVVVDFARLGPNLAQLCLGFGADELVGPVVTQRALRLGDNADNPALTRDEIIRLVNAANLIPCERTAAGLVDVENR
jgi:hypothetical protein